MTAGRVGFLQKAIRSCLETGIQKRDIFIVNDSLKKIKSLPEGIHKIKTEPPKQGAWTYCFEKAIQSLPKKYEYFFCLHDDDTLKKNYLKEMRQELKKNNSFSCVSCSLELIGENSKKIRSDQFQFHDTIFESSDQIALHYADHCIPFPPAFYRAKKVRGIKIHHEFKSFADSFYFLDLVKKGPIKIKSDKLYNYRIHQDQVSKNTSIYDELKFLKQLETKSKKNIQQVRKKISERVTNLFLNEACKKNYCLFYLLRKSNLSISLLYIIKKIKLTAKALVNLILDFRELRQYIFISNFFIKNNLNKNPKITVIIFSFNRPMQLHGLLESIYQNLENPKNIYVIWKCLDQKILNGYIKLKTKFPLVSFIREKNFHFETERLVKEADDSIMFATDDSLLFARSRIPSILNQNNIICFSLRLGENISYSHPLNRLIKKPKIFQLNEFRLWEWQRSDGEFGYPMSLDGHIFAKEFLLQAIQSLSYKNPNELEDALYKKIQSGPPSWILSFSSSRYISIPINRVQTVFPNRAGSKPYESPLALNNAYLKGRQIDIKKTCSQVPFGTHAEIQLKYKKEHHKSL